MSERSYVTGATVFTSDIVISMRLCDTASIFIDGPHAGGQGRKEMFYLTTQSTHFILRVYGVELVWRVRKPAAATTWATLF